MKKPFILVLDDDPTGIQTVQGVRVYYDWSVAVLRTLFRDDDLAYIQTNSRSLPEAEAVRVTEEIMALALTVSQETGRTFRVISRSDSSLRGHFPAEPDAIRRILEASGSQRIDGLILCFVLPEAGRQTVNNVHAIRQEDGTLLPVSESEFARDPTFGYQHANLTGYVAEKTKGQIPAQAVGSIPLEWLETGDWASCLSVLRSLTNAQPLVVNAISYAHLDVLTRAIRQAEDEGRRYVFRTAAAFVKAYAQIPNCPLLTRTDLLPYLTDGPVLTVVGSHTANTSRQLARLLEQPGAEGIELHVSTLLTDADGAIGRAVSRVQTILDRGGHPVLFTSRQAHRIEGSADTQLILSGQVSTALTALVHSVSQRPRAVIAKGGITSSDIATQGLGIRQGLVLGQIRPSIPVILTGEESRFPQLPYVIFPGNTGQPNDLVAIWQSLQ